MAAGTSEKSLKKVHDVWYQCLVICLACVTSLTLVVVTFLTFYSPIPDDPLNLGLYENEALSGDDEINVELAKDIDPAPFTFYIVWPVIFAFQFAWVIYLLTSFCRRNQFGPVFLNPPVITPFFLWVYCLGIAILGAWLFIFDRQKLVGSFLALVFFDILCLLAVVSVHRSVHKYGLELRQYHRRDLWAIRIVLLNGTMIFLTWLVVATHVALGSVMSFVGSIPEETSSTIVLAMLGTIVLVYFILENFVWDRFLRYTYTFWATITWALLGIFAENFGLNRNALITLFLLVIAGVLGLVKVALSVMRSKSNPLYVSNTDVDEPSEQETESNIYD